jgi:hypothetical protein
VEAMTPETQRIAIAEACGWSGCRHVEQLRDVAGIPPENWKGYKIPGLDEAWAPNYLNSLDAMHEAEMALMNEDPHAYSCYTSNMFEEHGSDAISLSAEKRAKTFLEVLGLWVAEN